MDPSGESRRGHGQRSMTSSTTVELHVRPAALTSTTARPQVCSDDIENQLMSCVHIAHRQVAAQARGVSLVRICAADNCGRHSSACKRLLGTGDDNSVVDGSRNSYCCRGHITHQVQCGQAGRILNDMDRPDPDVGQCVSCLIPSKVLSLRQNCCPSPKHDPCTRSRCCFCRGCQLPSAVRSPPWDVTRPDFIRRSWHSGAMRGAVRKTQSTQRTPPALCSVVLSCSCFEM